MLAPPSLPAVKVSIREPLPPVAVLRVGADGADGPVTVADLELDAVPLPSPIAFIALILI